MNFHTDIRSAGIEMGPVGSCSAPEADDHADGSLPTRHRSWKARALDSFKDRVGRVDERMNNSVVGRVFNLKGSGVSMAPSKRNRTLAADMLLPQPKSIPDANFSTELRAGLTTFATMSYIIAVNVRCRCGIFLTLGILTPSQASILADTGFDCECKKPLDNAGNCVNNKEWTACYEGQLKIHESIYFMCHTY